MMMKPQFQPGLQLEQVERYSEAWFEMLFQAVDQLHDMVSAERLTTVSPLAATDAIGWLEDIIYTAQECITEIRLNIPGERR